jgi:hypothetical protein
MNLTQKLKLVFAVSLAAAGSAFAATVYEVPAGENNYYSTSLEYGDEVTLAISGGGWVLESVSFPYYANYASIGGMTVSIYANDGALVNGKASPGTVLYSSGPIDIQNDGGVVTIPFAYSNDNVLTSPTFTYSVTFAGVGGANAAGLYVPNAAPTVGSSFNDYWEKSGTGWELRTITGGDLANFQVSITAVPEPSTVALAGLGLAGLVALAARRSKKA